MSWTAYDDPVVARKMTSLALQELGRWVGGDREFHEPWNVFVKWLKKITQDDSFAESILDVGCAAGYYRAIVKLTNRHISYSGIDRSHALLELGRRIFDAYDICHPPKNYNEWRVGEYDIVLSGSMLQHEEHWEPALAEQVRVCRRWLIIHKIPISETLVQHQKQAYGVTMDEWNFPVALINEKVGRKPVDEHYFASAEPHWSGLYDLEM